MECGSRTNHSRSQNITITQNGAYDAPYETNTMQAQMCTAIDDPWNNMEPVRIGSVPPTLGTPDLYVTVLDEDKPVIRIDVYGSGPEAYMFEEVLAWGGTVVIGYGQRLYIIQLVNRRVSTYNLEGYFGSLHLEGDRLVVASASNLLCFDHEGKLLWKSDELGLDGVVVKSIGPMTIRGEGEWDPPGRWRPFAINTSNGKRTAI